MAKLLGYAVDADWRGTNHFRTGKTDLTLKRPELNVRYRYGVGVLLIGCYWMFVLCATVLSYFSSENN